MEDKLKFSDSDILYSMIECLDYDKSQYGNDGPWYAQGEYHDISHFGIKGEKVTPYGVTDLERYESNKPKGFWKIYF